MTLLGLSLGFLQAELLNCEERERHEKPRRQSNRLVETVVSIIRQRKYTECTLYGDEAMYA
jgi:hypothetical protein